MELTLVLTRACNLACPYCYAGAKRGERMDAGMAERAVAWALARLPAGDELRLGYFGGEPLLAWDLLTAVHGRAQAQAAERGARLRGTVTTNATLLDDRKAGWLTDHGVVIGVSLDGPPDLHDRQRPRADGSPSSPAALAGLQAALRRQPHCQTISVVGPAAARRLLETTEFLIGQGVRVIGYGLDHTAAWEMDDLEAYRSQLEAVADLWLRRHRARDPVWIGPIDGKIATRIKGGLAECDQCSAGVGELALAPSGRWYPCERLVGDDGVREAAWVLGDAHRTADGGPDPALVAALRRRGAALPEECRSCPLRERCQNGCVCSNIMATGEPARPGGLLCASEQAAIAAADRVAAELWKAGDAAFLADHYRLRPE